MSLKSVYNKVRPSKLLSRFGLARRRYGKSRRRHRR